MNVELKTKTVREVVGKTVWIKYKNDWDRWYREVILSVRRRNIELDSDWKHFSNILAIRTDNPVTNIEC